MYGSRGAMLGSGGVSDGYEVGSKRQRMMESNPYFAVSSGMSSYQPYSYGGGFQPPAFPVVRLRGLPFNCTDIDIFKFFAGLDIVDVLLVNKNGRFSGEAFVLFAGSMQVEFALQRDRQNMGRRYVEVFRCKRQDYYHAVAAEVNYEGIYDNDFHGSPPPSRAKRYNDKDQMEYTEILKMRGLPFSVKKPEIVEFFGDFKIVEDRIHIACRPDGKATGEAYVEFASVEEAKRAMCKDKMTIGSRFMSVCWGSVLISAHYSFWNCHQIKEKASPMEHYVIAFQVVPVTRARSGTGSKFTPKVTHFYRLTVGPMKDTIWNSWVKRHSSTPKRPKPNSDVKALT
ncbi:hypothetical protein SCA6_002245 [Theobroma cacao]